MDDEVLFPKSEDGHTAAEGAGPVDPFGPVEAVAPSTTVPIPATTTGGTKGSRTGLVVGLVVVVLIAVVGVIVGVTATTHSASPPAPTGSPNKAVLTAIDSTLGAKTADLHVTMLITVPGKGQITASGGGSVDFAANTAQLTVGYGGQQGLDNLRITERYVGGSIYLSMPQISTVVPGKSWIVAPLGGSSVAPGSSNPASMFQVLQADGDIVTPLGASVVNGSPAQGYHVVITQAAIDKRLSDPGLPDAVRQAAEAAKGMFSDGGLSMDIYVSDANHMFARMVIHMHMTVAGRSATVQATEDTSDFGVPVSVTPPPSDQVTSLQTFTQAASAMTGTGTAG